MKGYKENEELRTHCSLIDGDKSETVELRVLEEMTWRLKRRWSESGVFETELSGRMH